MQRQIAKTQNNPAQPQQLQQRVAAQPDSAHPVLELQRTIGNSATQRLLRSPYVQAKLQVSTPEDPLEQEADRTADAVMRMPTPSVEPVQRKPVSTGVNTEETDEQNEVVAAKSKSRIPLAVREPNDEEEEPVQRACAECEEEQMVNRQSHGAPPSRPSVSQTAAKNIGAMSGGGSPLPSASRAFFEPRFGRGLGDIRVHSDSRAADSARSINAKAFTVGSNIAFASGQYEPHSERGQRLLAHELTHTIQQKARTGFPDQIQRDKAEGSAAKEKDPGPSFAAFDAKYRGIIAALSFEQLKIWHNVIAGWAHNRKVDEALARHEKRERSRQLDPSSTAPILSSHYLDEQARIESRRQVVDASASRVAIPHSAILSPEIGAPQEWNASAESRYRNWAIAHFTSKPLFAELSTKREMVSQMERSQDPGPGMGLPHVNLLWAGYRIKHTRGIVTWNDLMYIEEFRDKYYAEVSNSPEMRELVAGIRQLDSHIRSVKTEHLNRSQKNKAHGVVRHVSEFLGGPSPYRIMAAYAKAQQNPNDREAQLALAEVMAEAGNYPRLDDIPGEFGIWHEPELQLAAARKFLEEGKFELAVDALAASQQSTTMATVKFAGYERRVMRGAGVAVKWLERAKMAGKVASAFTGAGGVVRAALGSAGYSFAQEGSQQVVAHWIDPKNKIDLKGLTQQAAIDGLVSIFGGVTQGAFVNALSARFGAQLVTKYGISEGTAHTILNTIGATTSAVYNVPAQFVLDNIIAGKAFPKSLADVADMVLTEALESGLMEQADGLIRSPKAKAPEATVTEQATEIKAPRDVVAGLAGTEGSLFVGNIPSQDPGAISAPATDPSSQTKNSEVTPENAIKFVDEHPEVIRNRNKPGKRHAPVGDGHQVVEVPGPTGISCELWSRKRSFPCPKGMGTSEPALMVPAQELDLLMSRINKLPDKVAKEVTSILDRIKSTGDYHPEILENMVTKLRHMSDRDISHALSLKVQINTGGPKRIYHTPNSIWWDKLRSFENVSRLEAQLRGYGESEGRTQHVPTDTGTKGETISESTTPGGEQTKIESLVGDPAPRQGLENVLPSRSQVRDTEARKSLNIMVAERLHAIGAGFGAETGAGVTHGSSFVNQVLQNRGVEQLIRFLHANRPPGVRFIVHVDVRSGVGGGGETRPLESITYKVTAVEELGNGQFRELRKMFQGTISHPKKIKGATRPRGKGDIQGIGVEVEPNFGALAEHFGL